MYLFSEKSVSTINFLKPKIQLLKIIKLLKEKLNPIFFRIIAKKVIVDFASFIKLKFSKDQRKLNCRDY